MFENVTRNKSELFQRFINGCLRLASYPSPVERVFADCSGANFVCHDQSQVVSRLKYCDGKVDCSDGSDEPLTCGK